MMGSGKILITCAMLMSYWTSKKLVAGLHENILDKTYSLHTILCQKGIIEYCHKFNTLGPHRVPLAGEKNIFYACRTDTALSRSVAFLMWFSKAFWMQQTLVCWPFWILQGSPYHYILWHPPILPGTILSGTKPLPRLPSIEKALCVSKDSGREWCC